jgi:excisionase family DNA binding protein
VYARVVLCTVNPLLASKKEAAEALNVSPRTIHNLIARGELRAKRIGRRVLIPIAELQRLACADRASTDSEVTDDR